MYNMVPDSKQCNCAKTAAIFLYYLAIIFILLHVDIATEPSEVLYNSLLWSVYGSYDW